MRILTLRESKEADVDFIYKNGNHLAIIDKVFKDQWEKDEWKREQKAVEKSFKR